MKTHHFLFIPLAALVACSPVEAPHEGHDHANGAAETSVHQHDDEAGETPGAVQLDNGATWAANVETTDGIQAMVALVDGFDAAKGNGAVLKEELTAEFNEIFAKCTMTGEAHNQLHNYLIPVHGMLDSLGTEPSAAQLSALKQYLGTYGNYFH